MNKHWTVVRMANRRGRVMIITREGKMTRSGVKKLAKRHKLKHRTFTDVELIGYRYVKSDKRPKY